MSIVSYVKNRINPPIKVARMVRSGTHFYSILVTDKGFEYVFRSGHDHWSTISHKHGKQILERNLAGTYGQTKAKSMKDYLALASHGASTKLPEQVSGWKVDKLVKYSSRDEALKREQEILDTSWKQIEKFPENDN